MSALAPVSAPKKTQTYQAQKFDLVPTRKPSIKTPVIAPTLKPQPKPSNLQTSPLKNKNTAGGGITSIRTGEHNRYTRLVIDMEQPYSYTHRLSNNSKSLKIMVLDAHLKLPKTQHVLKLTASKRLDTIKSTFNAQENLSTVHINFKAPIHLEKIIRMAKTETKPYRMVIDLQDK